MRVHALVLTGFMVGGMAVSADSGLFLLWKSRGQIEPVGSALNVAARGNVVVASGNVCSGPSLGQCDWCVRAIDASEGVRLSGGPPECGRIRS
jgi:hypothetical protein